MNITFKILTKQFAAETIDLLTGTFQAGEPITKALGITQQDFRKYIELYTYDSIKYNLSVVAWDEDKNKIVGCTINRDYFAPQPAAADKIPASIKPMQVLMKQLSKKFIESGQNKTGEYFYLFIGGVLPEYSGLGINFQKAVFNEEVARRNRYKYVIVEPTGPATQHIYINKLGYKNIASIPYRQFVYLGENIFSGIENVENCVLAIKKL